MIKTNTKTEKIRQLLFLLIPIFITQLGMFTLNFFDTTMSGHYNSIDLAGVAIGSSLWIPVFTGLSGILFSVTPIVAQLVGAKETKLVSFSVIQAIYLGLIIAAFVLFAGSMFLTPLLDMMELEKKVREVAHQYLIALGYGIIPLFIFGVLRSYLDALGKTRVSMLITLMALPINLIFNYLLIFGKFGFPELGGVGAGYATTITYWTITMIAVYVIHTQKPFSSYNIFRAVYPVSLKKWKELLSIGIPIGFAIFFETSIFSAVTLLMSGFDTVTIASHQAAINFSSALYMIPLSISMGLTIVVGFEVGAKRFKDARQYSFIGIFLAVGMALFCGFILFFYREPIAGLYTADPAVKNLTAKFLLFAIFFQLSDALQAPIQGALRGYKDVNITFIMALVSYWLIGLPSGYFWANWTDWGPFGYWIGLITGLAVGAICLSIRLHLIQKRWAMEILYKRTS